MKLHFVLDSVYTNNLIKYIINNNLTSDEIILIYNGEIKYIDETNLNRIIKIKRTGGNFRLSKEFDIVKQYVKEADYIVFHYLSFEALWIINSFPNKEYGWSLWGGDFYPYINLEQYHDETKLLMSKEKGKISIKTLIMDKIALFLRKRAIKNIDYIYTWNNYDYELLKEKVKTNAKWKYFTYPYTNDYGLLDSINKNIQKQEELIIQVGNSGDETNNHIEIFKMLNKFNNNKFKVVTPLSYGNEEYIKKIIIEGNKILGDKFVPITKHMPLNEYYELLSKIDIAIMNHYRQQGAGNIVTLLYLGKKVYLNNNVTTFKTFKEWGINISSIQEMSNQNFNEFKKISDFAKDNNHKIIREKFNNQVDF